MSPSGMDAGSGSLRFVHVASPVGELLVTATAAGISYIGFAGERPANNPEAHWQHDPEGLASAREQLEAYFSGRLRAFDLPLAPRFTPFQSQVLTELQQVPYGATVTYGELARRLGKPRAARAVGMANARNPLPIIIPCHRVIGRNGALTGFTGGLERKRFLLTHEQQCLGQLI